MKSNANRNLALIIVMILSTALILFISLAAHPQAAENDFTGGDMLQPGKNLSAMEASHLKHSFLLTENPFHLASCFHR